MQDIQLVFLLFVFEGFYCLLLLVNNFFNGVNFVRYFLLELNKLINNEWYKMEFNNFDNFLCCFLPLCIHWIDWVCWFVSLGFIISPIILIKQTIITIIIQITKLVLFFNYNLPSYILKDCVAWLQIVTFFMYIIKWEPSTLMQDIILYILISNQLFWLLSITFVVLMGSYILFLALSWKTLP